ncbi:MAG: hypothetical protein V3R64_04390 [Sphingomonadales bacterium]
MKKFLFLLILVGLGSPALAANWPEDPNIETVFLTKEKVLELWLGSSAIPDPNDPYNAWDAYGYEKINKETKEVLERNFTFYAYLEQTSSRVWRSIFINVRVTSGFVNLREFCNQEYLKAEKNPACTRNVGTKTFVNPLGEPLKTKDQLKGSDFTMVADIEEFRTVWLIDFLAALKHAEIGKEIEVGGITFKKWAKESEDFQGFDEWKNQNKNYKITLAKKGGLEGKPWGYMVRFCDFLEGVGKCNSKNYYFPTVWVYFISPTEVQVEFWLGIS